MLTENKKYISRISRVLQKKYLLDEDALAT